ncbi:hypothetical protein BSL78_09908 [Apostichopus japonicus]|uniref:Ig-like domain-containing protein n=1 Tax=Stichopus japonicus TaxID=307972 RepID=A0A2G8KYY1_STIJA|nr:hypothetical protein BSL78_09908 [Apostichopus japonicus]
MALSSSLADFPRLSFTAWNFIITMTGNGAKTVVIFGLLLTSAFGEGESESITCDNQYFAELGKPSVIACNASGEQLDVYWFKGGDTSSFPILTLEDVRPDPPCPLIDTCSSTCAGCQLNVTTSGSLTCNVSGSRPMMDVDWIVTNQSGVSFTKEEQTHTEMDDRWYTEKTIQYTTPDCGADATFKCIASLSDTSFGPLLDTYYSTVRIKTVKLKYVHVLNVPEGHCRTFITKGYEHNVMF